MNSLYDYSVNSMHGGKVSLQAFKGKVLLIVNVASKCGFTPQYAELESLYQTYKDAGFEVLAFPCNQFASQEPGTDKEIAQFCHSNFGVSFELFSKIDVNGKESEPLYKFLKDQKRGWFGSRKIKWNFTKFLVDKEGRVVKRFAPMTKPHRIQEDIRKLLEIR